MSTTVDNRVVSMKFDNKDFEKNVATSLSTLDKLKQALDFKGASKGLSEVKSSVNGFDMNPLLNSVQTISDRFTTMGIIGTTALQNITNQAIQTGEQMLKSLTVEPIKEGFDEYELKMGSVQTIMAGIGADFADPEALAMVTDKLQELNTYADKTIYSFSDMTASIGKFTNAGVDLDKAVAAIQGISNEAAVSGANANEASRAMYNFAQALSAGSVKLIDWKSIENANMATVEFKQALIDAAVEAGTLADNLDGTYTVLTENNAGGLMDDVISTTQNFNDSLQYQWMTTDVLINTLGRYANAEDELGKKAFEAAQDVKTFSQLMDTLKEAVGSGWATTWEIIFGDFHESKQLWTDVNKVVSKFIDDQADARNSLLQGWKEMNGRYAVLDGLKLALEGIKNIIIPIKDAFREFFPAATAEQITNISFQFRGLMYGFEQFTKKVRESKGLENTFRGIFAILKIIYNALHTIAVFVSPLIGSLLTGGNGILNLLGSIGKVIADNQGTISAIIDKGLVLVIFNTVKALELLAGALGKVFGAAGSLAKSGIEKIFPKIGKGLQDLSKILSMDHSFIILWEAAFSKLGRTLEKMNVNPTFVKWVDSLGGLAAKVSKEIDGIVVSIKDGFKSFPKSPEGFGEFINSIQEKIAGLSTKISEEFNKVVDTITNCIQQISGSFSGFDSIETGSLENFVSNIQILLAPLFVVFGAVGFIFSKLKDAITLIYPYITQYLPVIADTVGDVIKRVLKHVSEMNASELMDWIRTGTLVSFAMSFRDVGKAFGGIGEMFESATKTLKELGGVLKAYQKDLNAKVLLKIAEAIGILALSLIGLSLVEPEKLTTSIQAIGTMFAMLVAALKLITGSLGDDGIKKAIGQTAVISALGNFMVEFATAIGIMTLSILALSELGNENLEIALKGVAAIEALLGAIAIVMSKMSGGGINVIALGIGLLMVATSVEKLANAVIALIWPLKLLGQIDRDVLIQGGIALAAMLAGISIALTATSKVSFGSAAGILAMTHALNEMVDIVMFFGSVDVGTLTQGMIALEAVFAGLSVLAGVAGKTKFGTDEGVGLVLMAVSLELIADVISKFGGMDIITLAKGLGVMAVVLIELSVAMGMMNGVKVGAAALVLMAVALRLLAPALEAFGNMEHPIKALLMLAGVLGVLAAAAAIFAVIAPGMLLLAAALTALGVGMILFAGALAIVAAIDLAAVVAMLPVLGVAILEFCKMVEEVGPSVKETVGKILDGIADLIKDKGPKFVDAIFEVITEIFKKLEENGASYIDTIFGLLEEFFKKLTDLIPEVVKLIVTFIMTVLEEVKNNITEITYNLIMIVVGFIVGVLEGVIVNIALIIQKVFELVAAIIDGVATALGSKENAEKLRNALINLGKSIVEFVKNFFGIHSPSTVFQEIGWNMIEGLIAGIGDMIAAAGEKIRELGEHLLEKIREKLDAFRQKGTEIMDNVKSGIDNAKESVKTAFNNIIDALKNVDDKVKGFVDSGKNLILGFKKGIEDGTIRDQLMTSVGTVFGAVRDRIAGIFQENSPSKVTFGFGRYVVEGFANGMRAYADTALDAADEFGLGTLNGIQSAVSKITDLVENGIDTDPTIRPVMDLSDVNSGIRDLNSMMDSSTSMDLAASANFDMNRMLTRNQNGVIVNNEDVVNAIGELKSDIADMGDAIRNLKLVLDSGTLVGGIVGQMDQALGQLMRFNERGI